MICVRMVLSERSANCCSDMPERPICSTGTVEALKLMISGGWMPTGNWRTASPEAATTCAFAVSMLAPGCRKIFTTSMPLYVVDSMCWMLSTSVVRIFSNGVVIRPSISSGPQAGVVPRHGDDRDVDVGKNVGRRAQEHDRAENQDQQRRHDERVGPVEGKFNNPHGARRLLISYSRIRRVVARGGSSHFSDFMTSQSKSQELMIFEQFLDAQALGYVPPTSPPASSAA